MSERSPAHGQRRRRGVFCVALGFILTGVAVLHCSGATTPPVRAVTPVASELSTSDASSRSLATPSKAEKQEISPPPGPPGPPGPPSATKATDQGLAEGRESLVVARHPLADVSDEEIARRVAEDLAGLGSMSVGVPHGGLLLNGTPFAEDPRWRIIDPPHTWGTAETVTYLARALTAVYEKYPGTPPVYVGHISRDRGGWLSPHKSHQSGRDVDLGFFYRGKARWYERGTLHNLDWPRMWLFVRTLITDTDVHLIFLDRGIQSHLRKYALSIGEDKAWLSDVFRGAGPSGLPILRHEPGHATHFHVRFHNPVAQETARRCYRALIEQKIVPEPVHYIRYKARKGDSLIRIAKHFGTTVKALKRANRLRSNKILARTYYKIPRKGPLRSRSRAAVPQRRMPPFDPPTLIARDVASSSPSAKATVEPKE